MSKKLQIVRKNQRGNVANSFNTVGQIVPIGRMMQQVGFTINSPKPVDMSKYINPKIEHTPDLKGHWNNEQKTEWCGEKPENLYARKYAPVFPRAYLKPTQWYPLRNPSDDSYVSIVNRRPSKPLMPLASHMRELFGSEISLQQLNKKLLEEIKSGQIIMDEICEVVGQLVSFSMWETIEFLSQHGVLPRRIQQGEHSFTLLHKALVPFWLWNYSNNVFVMSCSLERTQWDIVKTVELLFQKNWVTSPLETTPIEDRDLYNCRWQNSIALIQCVIPSGVLKQEVKKRLYEILTEPSEDYKRNNIMYILSRITCQNKEYEELMLQDQICWLLSLSPEKFVPTFCGILMSSKLNSKMINELVVGYISMVTSFIRKGPIKGGLFTEYFNKFGWSSSKMMEAFSTELVKYCLSKPQDDRTRLYMSIVGSIFGNFYTLVNKQSIEQYFEVNKNPNHVMVFLCHVGVHTETHKQYVHEMCAKFVTPFVGTSMNEIKAHHEQMLKTLNL